MMKSKWIAYIVVLVLVIVINGALARYGAAASWFIRLVMWLWEVAVVLAGIIAAGIIHGFGR